MKCVIYARVSSKEQEREGFSIPAQISLLEDYAIKNGLEVVRIFSESETAKKAGRKSFNEMLSFIKEKNINTVLVEKTDRLYRNFKDYVILEDYDLEVHLVKEGTILSKNSKSHEKFIHGIKVLMAKNYIDNLSEEVKKGLREKVKQGYYPQKAPVGYINIKNESGKKVIEIDEKKAPFVKKVFELYASGAYSVSQIRAKLFQDGFNHNLKPYSKARLLFVLKDVFYIGKFEYNGVIYDGKHDPLIDVELFNHVQKMFNVSKARSHEVEFPYVGLIKCGHCGCQLTAELKKGKYVYYHCTGKRGGDCKKDYVREEVIEKTFLNLLEKIDIPNDVFDMIKHALKDMQTIKGKFEDASTESITKQINVLSRRIEGLYTDKLDGNITNEQWSVRNNQWASEKENLIQKLHALNNSSQTFYEGANLLLDFCKLAPTKFLKASANKKRQILNLIGSNFTYIDKKLSVELSSVFDVVINSRFSENGAGDEARTRDIILGKDAFYH